MILNVSRGQQLPHTRLHPVQGDEEGDDQLRAENQQAIKEKGVGQQEMNSAPDDVFGLLGPAPPGC
jgi:hypothetical protein